MKRIHYLDTIVCPLITEKATMLSNKNKIFLKFIKFSNKKILKKNIEKIFKVNVTKINTIDYKQKIKIVRGRRVKVPGYKKAIVTLKKGQSIDLTTGL